jgi:hypothetical protein
MRFPDATLIFTAPFLAALALGGLATGLYFWVVRKLQGAGIPTRRVITSATLVKTSRTYRRLARDRGWPMWPIVVMWVAVGGMFVAGIVVAVQLQK